jgi:uncharacterized protein (TIGR03382 family)
MTNSPDGHGSAPTTEELRAQVEATRRDLGETVEALAARADLRAQSRQKAAALRTKAQHAAETTRGNPSTSAPLAAGVALLALVLLVRRRRHRRRR